MSIESMMNRRLPELERRHIERAHIECRISDEMRTKIAEWSRNPSPSSSVASELDTSSHAATRKIFDGCLQQIAAQRK